MDHEKSIPRLRLLSTLKSRIAVFSTVLFLVAIWGMAIRSAAELRDEESKLLSAQQGDAAGFVADGIDAALQLRIDALAAVAAGISPAWLDNPARLDDFLRARQAIYRLFPHGICIIGMHGRCLSTHPPHPERKRIDHADTDYFKQVIATGKPAVGRPTVSSMLRGAGIVIAVPVLDANKRPVAVLAGRQSVSDSEVFSIVTQHSPQAGELLVISPRDGIVVTDSRAARILEPLPPAGANRLYDRARTEGYEGSEIVADSAGVQHLASAARVPGTDWFVVASLPAAQAFAPIRAVARNLYRDAALLSLALAALVWLFVRRELAVLGRSAKALNDMTAGTLPFHPLPVEGSEEIAQMVESFNNLQEQVGRQQAALRASEARFRQMFESSSWITWLVDPIDHRIIDANRAAADFWGYAQDELRGMEISRIIAATPEAIAAGCAGALDDAPQNRTWCHRLKSGEVREVESFASPLPHGNRMLLYVIAFDVTERKQREKQETVRNRIFELLARGGDLKEILALVVSFVEQTHNAPYCSILLLDEDSKRLQIGAVVSLPEDFGSFCNGRAVGEDGGACAAAARLNQRMIVEDVHGHSLCAARIGDETLAKVGACWSEPIRDSAGKAIGVVVVLSRHTGAPGPADIELIQQAANLAAIAIEKKNSEAELQLASSVYQASDEAITVTDAENRIIAVNPAFTRVTGYTLEEVRGRNPSLLSAGRTSRAEYEAMWRALGATGQWQGEIWNRRKNGEEYAEWLTINALRDAHGEVHRYIAMFSDITEKKRTAELVWRQANYDTLTGLPNRNLFYDRLSQEVRKANRSGHLLALLYIDLDRFKEVNDAYGHDAGDALLVETAARISACVRDTDTVARLSGDEFAVVLPGVADVARVEQVAKAIVFGLAQQFQVGTNTAYVSASVGIAICPDDAEDAESLVKAADRAMYAAKEGGRNGFSYFTDSMQSAAQVRVQLSASLREALAKGQFEIYYQPIVDLKTRHVVKAEALLRWRHPEHGLIQPSAFIPLAEELGLIGEIGDWVFRESALLAKRWRDSHPHVPAVACPVQISINKSPRQFSAGARQENWLGYLQKIGLPSHHVAMEITESLLLDDSHEIKRHIEDLRASGVQVALDDFGTGYSSMGYLNKFRVDYVKIDRTFVQGIAETDDDRTIVEAIIVMAHKLKLKVIAEGVETERQCEFLAAAGCDFAQGFLFAKPMPQADFEALLFAGATLPPPAGENS